MERRITKSQARRAGERLRKSLREYGLTKTLAEEANAEAWDVVRRFQREHVLPTSAVAVHVAGVAHDLDGGMSAPRIKRAERIIEKIARGKTALDRLQDIGGCRIIVGDLVVQELATNLVLATDWEIVDVDDYVAPEGTSQLDPNGGSGPKGSGYRAIHVVQRVDDRLIETQIRTKEQHAWAAAAEKAEQLTGHPLKFGDAPPELIEYFRIASSIIALQEWGQDVDNDLVEQLSDLREQIRRYYRRTE